MIAILGIIILYAFLTYILYRVLVTPFDED